MIVTRTYKYKLYKSKQVKHLHQQIDVSGIIWNHCVALHRKYYKLTGKHLNQFQLMKHVAKLKKLPKYSFWSMVGSQAIQDIVQRVEKSYKLFFRNLKAKVRTSPPRFQKVKRYKSFTLKQAGWKLLGGNKIKIQGKVYKFSKSRDISDNIKTVTVKRDSLGDIYLYFVVQEDIQIPSRQGNVSVGFDFGMKQFLTSSDGSTYESPLLLKKSLGELRIAQRNLSSKVKFSNNWYKAKTKVTKIHKRIANQRRDYFFKLAHELTDKYDMLFFEDLNMKGMQRIWGRKISDLARSEFMSILEWVAIKKGCTVGYVDRFFASSKLCNDCGHKNKELTLSDRRWACTSCGTIHDRDKNASDNIHDEGLRVLNSKTGDGRCSLNLGTVRRASLARAA